MQEGEELSLRPLHTNLSSHAAYTRRARQCHGFGQGLCCGIHDESSTLCTQAIPTVQRRAITSNRRLDCTEVEIELLVLGPSLGHNKSLSSPVRATSTILISATTFYSSSHMSTVHMSHVGALEVRSPLTRSRGLFNFSPYSVPRYEHTTQAVHRLPLTCLCLGLSQVPPRRQQERQRIRIHGPRSLPRPRPRASVSSFLALKVRPASGQHRISNPRR